MKKNFADRFIRSLQAAPPGKRIEHWDARVPCFGVRVTDRGHKTFVLYARFQHPAASHWQCRFDAGLIRG